jgi:hypothetical protein
VSTVWLIILYICNPQQDAHYEDILLQSWEGTNRQILIKFWQKLIQAGGEMLCSEICNLLNSIWNKEEWPEQ